MIEGLLIRSRRNLGTIALKKEDDNEEAVVNLGPQSDEVLLDEDANEDKMLHRSDKMLTVETQIPGTPKRSIKTVVLQKTEKKSRDILISLQISDNSVQQISTDLGKSLETIVLAKLEANTRRRKLKYD